MWKCALLVSVVISLASCAHRGQPKARCTGHLERINVAAPESAKDPSTDPKDGPVAGPKDEGGKP